MSRIPEVRLYVSRLIVNRYSRFSVEELQAMTDAYRAEWKKIEERILAAITERLGVDFYLSTIDVYIADRSRSTSMPLIMRPYENPQDFVDVLIHELCHNLLCDNSVMSIKNTENPHGLTKIWTALFGDHPMITRNHIPVQALMKHIYLDVLKDASRYERDLQRSEGKMGYEGSWAYVNEHGYQAILDKLKQSYGEMSTS